MGLIDSTFVNEAEVKDSISLLQQKRDFAWLPLPLNDLAKEQEVTQEEIQSYYDNNKQDYLTEEKLSLEYISYTLDDLVNKIEISEQEVTELGNSAAKR